jgi:hypothetical protein
VVLGLLSTGRWALETAGRAAALFEEVDRGADAARHAGIAGERSRASSEVVALS